MNLTSRLTIKNPDTLTQVTKETLAERKAKFEAKKEKERREVLDCDLLDFAINLEQVSRSKSFNTMLHLMEPMYEFMESKKLRRTFSYSEEG